MYINKKHLLLYYKNDVKRGKKKHPERFLEDNWKMYGQSSSYKWM